MVLHGAGPYGERGGYRDDPRRVCFAEPPTRRSSRTEVLVRFPAVIAEAIDSAASARKLE